MTNSALSTHKVALQTLCKLQTYNRKPLSGRTCGNLRAWELCGRHRFCWEVSSVNTMFSFLDMLKKGTVVSGYVDKEAYVLQSPKGDKQSKHPYLLKNSCIQFLDHSYLGHVFRNYVVFLFSERKHHPSCIVHFFVGLILYCHISNPDEVVPLICICCLREEAQLPLPY